MKNILKRIATSLAMALIATIAVYFSIQIKPTTRPVPGWIVDDVRAFAGRLGVQTPTVKFGAFDGRAFVVCNDHGCKINLGTRFDVEQNLTSSAIISHEMGHVWQGEHGKTRRHDPAELLFFLVALAIFLALPNTWARLAGLAWLCCVAVLSRYSQFITFDQVIPVALLAFIIPAGAVAALDGLLFQLSGRTDRTYRNFGLSAGRFAFVVALVGCGWIGVRGWGGAGQIPLEFEADKIGACLTSEADITKMLAGSDFRVKINLLLPPIYHPTSTARIGSVSSFNRTDCPNQ